ncbi:DUF4180 domain-containing protein [candidate division KSB1 bacterium]|nr:DUF4180 domain-containing protein [candidate division KSB1 bacterium]
MELRIHDTNGKKIAEIISDEVIINTVQDALDIMGNANYQDALNIILYEKNIIPAFFDLKTGLAGEILQKFSNYNMKLALVGEFGKYTSNSLKAFIIECNRGNRVFFVDDFQTALNKLLGD